MEPRPRSGGVLPWLLLLPPALLSLPEPVSLLRLDPYPRLAGTALVALCTLPVAMWLALRGGPRLRGAARGLGILGALWALALGLTYLRTWDDPFEAHLRTAWIGCALVLALGGAALDPLGRRTFNRGLVVISCALTLAAIGLWRLRGESGLAGPLGNTGLLSQAALPGAAIGAWYVATRTGTFRVLGGVAFVAFLVHSERSPVVAGSLALLGVLVLSALRSPWSRGRARVRRLLGGLGAVVAFTTVLLTTGPPESARTAPDPTVAPTAGDSREDSEAGAPARELGGVPVRLRIWQRVGAVLADHPWLGLGPGQFQTAFPPYRDPVEMELSRGGRCERGDTEVDHPHSDWLLAPFELGLLGGGLVLALFLLAMRACLRALGSMDFATIAQGAGGLGLLLNGLGHGPLFENPVAGAMGWVLLGAVLAGTSPGTLSPLETGGPSGRARLLGLGALLPAAVAAWAAWPAWGHGRDLAAHGRALIAGDRIAAGLAVQRALDRVPASAPAALLRAHGTHTAGEAQEAIRRWLVALTRRPHDVGALTNRGALSLRLGDPNAAREAWERAVALGPTHPRSLENLTRLLVLEFATDEALPWIERTRANGCTPDAWFVTLGLEALARGRWRAGAALLFERPLEELSPEAVFAAAAEPRFAPHEGSERRVRALAHLLWAREQRAAGDTATAVRSFRQALVVTRDPGLRPRGAPGAVLELAALLLLAGQEEAARAEAQGLAGTGSGWEELPAWARSALRGAGLAPGP